MKRTAQIEFPRQGGLRQGGKGGGGAGVAGRQRS